MKFSLRLPVVAMTALLCVGSFAQPTTPTNPTTSTTPGAAPMTSAPAGVGTSAKTAAEANQKAIQRPDTGTVVRTSPSVADRARDAAPAAAPAINSTPMPSDTTAGVPRSNRMRAARADRN